VTVRPQRVLVAGLGNIFLGDDAFGVEVVRRLSVLGLPDDVRLIDVGIRSVHLAYELRERTYDTVILIDVVSRGGEAGTLYVLEPDDDEDTLNDRVTDGHAIHPHDVIALVRQLGGRSPRMIVVGCEPFRTGPDSGLSPRVAAAVDEAVALVTRLASAVAPLMAVRI
jgi:hydrogenase maturation protease